MAPIKKISKLHLSIKQTKPKLEKVIKDIDASSNKSLSKNLKKVAKIIGIALGGITITSAAALYLILFHNSFVLEQIPDRFEKVRFFVIAIATAREMINLRKDFEKLNINDMELD